MASAPRCCTPAAAPSVPTGWYGPYAVTHRFGSGAARTFAIARLTTEISFSAADRSLGRQCLQRAAARGREARVVLSGARAIPAQRLLANLDGLLGSPEMCVGRLRAVPREDAPRRASGRWLRARGVRGRGPCVRGRRRRRSRPGVRYRRGRGCFGCQGLDPYRASNQPPSTIELLMRAGRVSSIHAKAKAVVEGLGSAIRRGF